jgi:protein ImuB
MLWLSLHLAQLPLEIFTRGLEHCGPAVAAEGGRQRAQVCVANRAAEKLGVHAGLSVAAAQALASGLNVFQRDPLKEAAALASLATWAGQFTSNVSLESDGLLLEIGGSLKLFGGADKLMEKVRQGVRGLGYRARLAAAPTPLGAALLARAGEAGVITDHAPLAERLSRLPITLLDMPLDSGRAHADMLEAMGILTLGAYLALPRAGLKRRFGDELLDQLDRALGVKPDPRECFEPPAQFASRLELPAEVHETSALLFAAKRLINELEGFLRGRGVGVQQFHLDLLHADHPATRATVGLVTSSRDGQRLLSLLRERLERVTLPQPVREIVLVAERTTPYQARNLDLFPDASEEAENAAPFIERLRARLGDGMVHSLECVADHRPELAMKASEPGVAYQAGAASRPLWLLPQPRPLHCRNGVPQLGLPLILRQGPERIESGWWDGRPVARDYFVAEAVGGPRYWVYREAMDAGKWFLHGIFA